MKSQDKIKVERRQHPTWGKDWVFVSFLLSQDNWIPSFEDLFRIIRPICECEDDKYPNGKGRAMVREFLCWCCNPYVTWQELADKFEIPDRSNNAK